MSAMKTLTHKVPIAHCS